MKRFHFMAVLAALIILSTSVLRAEETSDSTAAPENKMMDEAALRAALNVNQSKSQAATDPNAMQKIALLQSRLQQNGGKLGKLNEEAEKMVPQIQTACANEESPECGVLRQRAGEILKDAKDIQDQMKQDQSQLWEIMTEEQTAQEIPASQ